MKKFFSHPLFYCIFALLGLAGMGLQSWYLKTAPDTTGLLTDGHPGGWLTFLLLGLVLVLTVASMKHIQTPRLSPAIRSVGAAMTAGFTAIAAGVLLTRKNYLVFGLCVLSAISALYILWAQTTRRKPHYGAYSLFAGRYRPIRLLPCVAQPCSVPESDRHARLSQSHAVSGRCHVAADRSSAPSQSR